MKIKDLGQTGLQVSEVGLGAMTFGQRANVASSFAIMDLADEAGITFIDTADVYPPPSGPRLRGRSERIVGRWLRARGARHRIVLATKVGRPMGDGPEDQGLSRQHIVRACDDSLRRLQTDYIDLYQAHIPDADVPIDETLSALDDLVRAGKVRRIGCSNYSAKQLAEALGASGQLGLQRFDCAQLQYNLLSRASERTLFPLCTACSVAVIAYSPLAGGVLTDRRANTIAQRSHQLLHPGVNEPASEGGWDIESQASALRQLLETRGKSLTHIALAWVLAQPIVSSAVVGASRPEQLADTLRGVGSALDDAEWSACDAVWSSASGEIKDQRE